MEAVQGFVKHFAYLGIFAVLLLGSLGVPIPEEMSVIATAVLSHEGIVRWWLALPVCLLGVLSGDVVLYWVGQKWGEHVLNWRMVRLVLTPEREQRLKAAYRRLALKTGRHGAACHGARHRRVSSGQPARAVLEVHRSRRGLRHTRGPVRVWFGLLFSRIRSKPSWPMCTGWSAGLFSLASWCLGWFWSSACGGGNVASGRNG